jgi:glycine/D-amino acid oxidase-like deaminating enzyme
MSANSVVAVIGGGIFGCMTAIAVADKGIDVVLLELQDDILSGASKNNFNRVHYGYHYPRDLETALQSKKGFDDFVNTFSGCLTEGFPNYYFIADEGSKTSPEQYLEFCRNAGLGCEVADPKEIALEVRKCSLGVAANEVVYDHDLLRNQLRNALRERPNIRVECNAGVEDIRQWDGGYRLALSSGVIVESNAVVNSSYANINKFGAMLGKPVVERQYEYTVVPVVETDFDPIGIAIMDGPFPSMMPYGRKGLSLLYHVEHSVIATEVTGQLNQDWLSPETSPFQDLDPVAFFENFKDACANYIPAIADTRLTGFLQGPRMVLAHHDNDDARPSLIDRTNGDLYITIFSGKVDHSLHVADKVASILRKAL